MQFLKAVANLKLKVFNFKNGECFCFAPRAFKKLL